MKKYLTAFNVLSEGKGKMELFENLEHKYGELISFDFKSVSDDINRQKINIDIMKWEELMIYISK